MKTILAAMFAVMIGLIFVGSTFADEKKMDAPAAAPAAGEVKKEETTKTEKTKTASLLQFLVHSVGKPTTRDPIYDDLCSSCCRAENE